MNNNYICSYYDLYQESMMGLTVYSKEATVFDCSKTSFLQLIHNRDIVGINAILSQVQDNSIPVMRQFVKNVIQDDNLRECDFWFIVSHLLSYDRRIYRKPIAEAVESLDAVSSYLCPEDIFDNLVHIMLEDQDKLLDGLRFLYALRINIKESHHSYIKDRSKWISQPLGFSLLFEILGLTTEERIDLTCDIATTPALFALFQELANAEEKYGIWYIQGLSNFPDRLNTLPHTYETQLFLDLIEKNVLHEDINENAEAVSEIEQKGYASFAKFSAIHKSKKEYKRNIRTIGSFVGKDIKGRVLTVYEKHYLVQTFIPFAVTGLLPIAFATNTYSAKDEISCRVISRIKGQNLLLLSQKPCKKSQIESIPVITKGSVYEAKFCLANNKLIAEIMGYGPIRTSVVRIPRNFDYKKHHRVRIVSSKLATCDIEILD